MGSEWKEHRLGDLICHQKGHAFKSKDYRKQGHGIVRVSDFTDRSVDTDSCNYLAEELAHNYDSVALKQGDVVIATVGSWPTNPASVVGKTIRVPREADSFLLNQNAVKLTANEPLDQTFLFYLLKTETFGAYIVSAAQGSASQASITLKSIFDFAFPLPPLPEQKAIAHILGTLDDKIELNRRMNATLEGMAQALFKSWFVDFDPVIDNALAAGNPIPEELAPRAEVRRQALANGTANRGAAKPFPAAFQCTEELGWIPEGWKVKEFGKLAQNIRDGVAPTTLQAEMPYVGLEHIDKQCLSLSRWGTAAEVDSQKSQFKPDDFLFGKLRPYFHKVCQVISEGICSTDILVIRPQHEDDAGYVGCQIFEPEFVEYANLRSTGTRMPRASWKDMAQYEVACPPENLRKAFNDLIKPTREKCAGNVVTNQTLTKLRDTLLPQLISGDLKIEKVYEGNYS